MYEEKIKNIVNNFESKYRNWLSSQDGQKSAYDYEKSYTDFMREISQDTLESTTSSNYKSRNSKKKYKPQWDI